MKKRKKKKGKKKKKIRKGRKAGNKHQEPQRRDSFVIKPLENLVEMETCVPNLDSNVVQEIMNLCSMSKEKLEKIAADDLYFFFRKFSHGIQKYPDRYDCKMIVDAVDRSESGRISFHDFRRFLKKKFEKGDCICDLGFLFELFDRNGDGEISVEEVFLTLKDLGEQVDDMEHVKQWLLTYDLDGDEKLDRSEFDKIIFEGLGTNE